MSKKMDKRASVEVPLEFPIAIDGQTISKLTMRRPKVKDSLAAGKHSDDQGERGMFMLARLCDVPPEYVEELDQYDADALEKQFEAFRGGGAS